ncbi:uncharacterized protein L3040_007313 [Drepanopeziza brunnea f. sp. 'multigermtubi']|uniref:uncharacterized protein n=1 Tax=Drepanopeziza brunnea f. sp. 'multigermtubi' TaxID=698441 RepID=UPI0023986AAA|nr:hypothetical protein L3040_007313 [Drepanopeziza brunnea f. sp. 'multigermtubi']
MSAHSFPGQMRRRIIIATVLLTAITMVWKSSAFSSDSSMVIKVPKLLGTVSLPQRFGSTSDLSYLAPHIKSSSFTYAHRSIRTRYVSGERSSLSQIPEPLLGAPYVLSNNNLTALRIDNPSVLTLEVPKTPQVDTSILSFGIATKLARLEQALAQLEYWLPASGAQLHVSIPGSSWPSFASESLTTEQLYQHAKINMTLHMDDKPFAKAYFGLIKTLYEARAPNTQWLVLIDDDTFLPSLPYLVHHLQSSYDVSQQALVAALSDNFNQVRAYGLMPFGGGGIFISMPLAEFLVQKEVWDKCLENPKTEGDQIVHDCLNGHSIIRPAHDAGLQQMDIHGDPSGYFESGRRLLTIHHWKSWYHVDIPLSINVSKACGFECLFQRWSFTDNIVLSNGYSVVEYPSGFGGLQLSEVELTWDGEWKDYIHHMGPLRARLDREKKRSARLVESSVLDGIGVRQIYVDKAENMNGEMDRVVELLWLF